MARGVVTRLSLACLVASVAFPLSTSTAQGSDSWLVSESEAKGEADLKLDMAAAKRALGGDQASADVQKRLIKAIRGMLRSYPGKNRLFDAGDAPPGAVDVTVPFLDLVQVERTVPAQAAAQVAPASAPVIPVQVGSTVAGVPGAIWADRNNDGRVDGFVFRGQYYAGQPAASLMASSAGGSATNRQYYADVRGVCYYYDARGQMVYDYNASCAPSATTSSTTAADALRLQRRRERQAESEREFEAEQAAIKRRMEMERQIYDQIHSAIGAAIERGSSNDQTIAPSIGNSNAPPATLSGNSDYGSTNTRSIEEQEREAQEFLMRRQQQWDAEAAAERAAAEMRQRSFQNAFQRPSGSNSSNQSCGIDKTIQVINGRQCYCRVGRTDGWNSHVNLPDC